MKAQIKVSVNTLPMPKSFMKFAGNLKQEAGAGSRGRRQEIVLLLLPGPPAPDPSCLEVQPQPKLELSRVKSGGRATAVTTIAGSLTKRIYLF